MELKTIVSALSFIGALYASEKEDHYDFDLGSYDSSKVNVLSFNIDTNIGVVEEGLFRESHDAWRINNRMPAVLSSLKNIITSNQTDIIHIQECRQYTTKFNNIVDSLTPVWDLLESFGYTVSAKPLTTSSDKSFISITAFNEKRFDFKYEQSVYFTKTQEKATDHPDITDKTKEEIK